MKKTSSNIADWAPANEHGLDLSEHYAGMQIWWKLLMRRCRHRHCREFESYGAKGIFLDDSWKSSSDFVIDMWPTYRKGWFLHRRDTASGFSRDNCVWLQDSNFVQALQLPNNQAGLNFDDYRKNLQATWGYMMARCYDPAHAQYHLFGAAGIKVCPEWQGNSVAFILAMWPTYATNMALYRRSYYLDFSPTNCVWEGRNVADWAPANAYGLDPQEHVTALESCWAQARGRCNNPKLPFFKNYGGRGIQMGPEWINNFRQFFKDMWPTFQPGLTIDRFNVNGDYTHANCRWADLGEQGKNRTDNHWVETSKGLMILKDACRVFQISPRAVSKRLARGVPEHLLFERELRKGIPCAEWSDGAWVSSGRMLMTRDETGKTEYFPA